MRSKLLKRALAGILAGVLLCSGIPTDSVLAAKDSKGKNTVGISSAYDLIKLAQDCRVDEWSKGKTIVLENDVDLSGTDFEMIPVFAGTFDGKGHTIRGLQYQDGKYVAGFFRYITEDGTVRNLTLEAAVSGAGDSEKQSIGGLCGENSGMIDGCTFYGTVDGRTETGGIAGSNTASGTIKNCVSKGVVTGMYDTGGIVGKNHGMVTRCVNSAGVNNSKEWVSTEDENGLDWLKTIRNEDESISIQSGVDTGGIAGYSDGVISRCKNEAVIGYEHTGYNVGGIAGRQAGLLSLCDNSGEVYGRKDVGGIVGQMEPYIKMNEADNMEAEIQKLHDLIDKLLDDVDASSDTVSADYGALKNSADAALNTSNTIAGQMTDFVDDNVDAVNELASRVEYIVDALPDIQKNVSDAVDYMAVINEDLKKINDDFAVIDQMKDTAYAGTTYDRLTLVSSVGGDIVSDNSTPAKGIVVTLTPKPQDGYRAESVTAYDANGASVAVTKTANGKYTFTMPENNVVVQASFVYAGKYMASSNAGGEISLTESDTQLTVRVQKKNDGFRLAALAIGNKAVPADQLSNNSITVNKADYPMPDKNVVEVQGTFENQNSNAGTTQPNPPSEEPSEGTEHTVKAYASAGGTVSVDKENAAGGETITVTPIALGSYSCTKDSVTVVGASGGKIDVTEESNGTYSFIMPDEDVVVSVKYEYQPDKDTVVCCESSAGGEVAAVPVPLRENRYTITVTPDSEHRLPEQGDCLRVYPASDMTGEAVLSVSRSQMNHVAGEGYTYILDLNQISDFQAKKPFLVYVSFETSEPRHTVTSLSATGGSVATDLLSVGQYTSVQVFPHADKEYQLKKVRVTGKDSGKVWYEALAGRESYDFTMPDEGVYVEAVFAPAPFAVVSNVGGSADYTVDGSKVTVTIHSSAGYSLSGNPVVRDSAGKSFAVAKTKSNDSEYMVDISGASGVVIATVTFGAQNQYDALKAALDEMASSSAAMQNAMTSCRLLVDEMSGILLDSSGNPVDWSSISGKDKDTLAKDIVELAKQLSTAGSAAGRMAGSISIVANIAGEYAIDTAEALNKDIGVLNDHMQDMVACLDDASAAITSVTDYLALQSTIEFAKLGTEFDNNVDTLYENLLDISDRMEQLEQDITSTTKTLTKDFREINSQLNTVLLLFVDKMDQIQNPDKENYYKDVSDEDIEGTATGKVKGCRNYGVVEGDINIGGVAGAMAIDEEDPEDSAAGTSQHSLGAVYQTKCILQSSKNYGYVKAKRDGAGGVIGCMKLGVVTDCEAYGEIKSIEGDYAGGICGDSTGVIRKSYALCTVEGGSYVGGITGYGEGIYNCYAMVKAVGEDSRTGAIAGQVGERNEDGSRNQEDYAKDNFYVGDEICGIDGISYIGVAEPVSYKKLLTAEGLPSDYSHLTVSYVIDGKCVEQEEVPYGEKLDNLQMPEIPDKDGQNGVWPEVTGEVMTSNRVLEAEYVDDVTVLGSEECADNAGEQTVSHPCAFVEGAFTGKAKLNAQLLPNEGLEELPVSGSAQIYDIKLNDTRLGSADEFSLRLWNAYGSHARVYQYTDTGWKQLKSREQGSYCQVSMTGTENIYAVVDADSSKIYIFVIAGCAAAAVLVIIICKYGKKRKNRKKRNKKK